MKDENIDATIQNAAAENKQIEIGNLTPYHAPTLQHYGGLAELVQRNPGAGSDGGSGDCQHS